MSVAPEAGQRVPCVPARVPLYLWVFRAFRSIERKKNLFFLLNMQNTRNTHKIQRDTARDTRNTDPVAKGSGHRLVVGVRA